MFSKRFHLLSISGFKIGIDISWFIIALLLSWTLAVGYFPHVYPHLPKTTYWVMGISGMVGLFICVILHELGHAVVARHYKLPISQITLFIFGGVAEIKKEPTSPKVEFLMAIAGPIVSFILSFCLYLVTKGGTFWGWPIWIVGVTAYLAWINFILAIFNLIPAFPLDGGRIFRAILWGWKKNLSWATRVATRVGAGFGFLLIFLGVMSLFLGSFLSGFWLMILGWFLYRAAASVRSQQYLTQGLEGEKVQKIMTKNPISVDPDISIKDFVEEYVYSSHHHLYPVTENHHLTGYVSLKGVKSIHQEAWDKTKLREIMISCSSSQIISPEISAKKALSLFQETDLPILFVVKESKLVGILTAQDLLKFISIKMELDES